MKNSSTSKQVSFEIIRDPERALYNKHLDLLVLENNTLEQLHPLAQVIALSKRGRISEISKAMMHNAVNTVVLNGYCCDCTEEDGDPDPIYFVKQQGKASISKEIYLENGGKEEICVEFQLSFDMEGETVDGDASLVEMHDKVTLSLRDLQHAESIVRADEKNRDWPNIFLSSKSSVSAVSPEGIYLCGEVSIALEAVRLSANDIELATLMQPSTPIATLHYSQGELVDTQLWIPLDPTPEAEKMCFWPRWLPDVATELTQQATSFYLNRLSHETDDDLVNELHDALSRTGELCTDASNEELYFEVEEVLDLSNFTPRFRGACFELSQADKLPDEFMAGREIDLACLGDILIRLLDINAAI